MAVLFAEQRRSLLSSQARVQVPWVKVTIGNYIFGIFTKEGDSAKDEISKRQGIQYPRFVQGLTVEKINGQVNQYTLNILYPITSNEDPNFFEKVFSSVSGTRKIVFTYGDAAVPSFIYKDEEAIITNISQTFNLQQSCISYTINAVSGAALALSGCNSYPPTKGKPSSIIKDLFKNKSTGLSDLFTGMSIKNLDQLIDGTDQEVELDGKMNTTVMEYITYLVSCMVPDGTTRGQISPDIYILTIHDETTYDTLYNDFISYGGPYFKVTKTSYNQEHSDAYEIDIGYNTSTLVRAFSIQNNQNYSILFDYQNNLSNVEYVERTLSDGTVELQYAPAITSKNDDYRTREEDKVWWTKTTRYPITAQITVQGLLRPAQLMTYLRLNVIFPGGHKHLASGLYIVTKQIDTIDRNGYVTQLDLVRISGDDVRTEIDINQTPNNKSLDLGLWGSNIWKSTL